MNRDRFRRLWLRARTSYRKIKREHQYSLEDKKIQDIPLHGYTVGYWVWKLTTYTPTDILHICINQRHPEHVLRAQTSRRNYWESAKVALKQRVYPLPVTPIIRNQTLGFTHDEDYWKNFTKRT